MALVKSATFFPPPHFVPSTTVKKNSLDQPGWKPSPGVSRPQADQFSRHPMLGVPGKLEFRKLSRAEFFFSLAVGNRSFSPPAYCEVSVNFSEAVCSLMKVTVK